MAEHTEIKLEVGLDHYLFTARVSWLKDMEHRRWIPYKEEYIKKTTETQKNLAYNSEDPDIQAKNITDVLQANMTTKKRTKYEKPWYNSYLELLRKDCYWKVAETNSLRWRMTLTYFVIN